MSPALVSRRLAALEARLGVRLINRTTRSLHLTDEGASYYETCTRVLAEIEEADAAVSAGRARAARHAARRPARLLRQPARRAAGAAVRRALSRRAARAQPFRPHRERGRGRLRPRDPHRRRWTTPRSPRASSRPTGAWCARARSTCGATARRARPRTSRSTTACTTTDFAMNWDYREPDGKPGSVRVAGRYACDNWEVLREWALAGLGIALKSTWDVRRHLEDGVAGLASSGLYLRQRRGHLRGLSSPASPAREDPRVHRFPRRVVRP